MASHLHAQLHAMVLVHRHTAGPTTITQKLLNFHLLKQLINLWLVRHPLPLTYKYPSHHLMISNANLLHTIVVLLPHPTPSKFSSRGFLVRHGQHQIGCPV